MNIPMTTENSTQESSKWTIETSRLSFETFGSPADGIRMECHIGVEDERGKIRTPVTALWDTGTSMTVITPDVARKLKPKVIDTIVLNGLGGTRRVPVCAASVLLPNGLAYGPIAMAIDVLPTADVLLGMDVISIGTFLLEPKPDGGTKFMFIL